jgi:uncharacterized Ntn-hydrolase superfamily protein
VAAVIGVAAAGQATATWSVLAVDPQRQAMGVASASCLASDIRPIMLVYPELVPFGRRPGRPARGVGVVQAAFESGNWSLAGRLMKRGLAPGEVVARLADPARDPRVAERQYAVIGARGAVATFTGPATLTFSGARTARGLAVLGNSLTGREVIDQAFAAYGRTRSPLLERRLIRALAAGGRAGGDVRCGSIRATTAGIWVEAPGRSTFIGVVTPGRNAVAVLQRKLRAHLARLADR